MQRAWTAHTDGFVSERVGAGKIFGGVVAEIDAVFIGGIERHGDELIGGQAWFGNTEFLSEDGAFDPGEQA